MNPFWPHLASRLRHYSAALGWQALMLFVAFVGYCIASAILGRMATFAWFAGVYVATGLAIQLAKEVSLCRRALSGRE